MKYSKTAQTNAKPQYSNWYLVFLSDGTENLVIIRSANYLSDAKASSEPIMW